MPVRYEQMTLYELNQYTTDIHLYIIFLKILWKYIPKLKELGLKNCSGGGYEGGTPRFKLLSCTSMSKMSCGAVLLTTESNDHNAK